MLKKLKNFISDKWQRFKKLIIIALFGSVALASGLSGIPQDIYNNLNVKVYTACNLQEARRVSIADDLANFKARNPDNSLRVLNAQEKASIKSCEITKRGTEFAGIYNSAQYGTKIEIIGDVKNIEINGQHGIELFAKAWRGTQQLGFGADGSVEIERFRIFNPPILVDDPNGTIIREWTDSFTGQFYQRKLREDPLEAIKQVIAHNVKIVGKDNNKIVVGKIGNTTSTFYPDADPETTSFDGNVNQAYGAGAGQTWATIHDLTVGSISGEAGTTVDVRIRADTGTNNWRDIQRGIVLFDTSTLPDTDTINSATMSVYGQNIINTLSGTGLNIYSSTPASNTAIANEDYDQLGTTAFSSAISTGAISTTAYNDFVLNASGLAGISKTSVSKFGARESSFDAPNSSPTWGSGLDFLVQFYSADQAGTTSDPKLVVVHSGAAAAGEEYTIIFE